MGPTDGPDGGKFRPHRDSIPGVQPVVSRIVVVVEVVVVVVVVVVIVVVVVVVVTTVKETER